MKKIIIGSRGSKLSLAYAEKVKNLILTNEKNIKYENLSIHKIKTSGDKLQNQPISKVGGKSLFCKEIEENLINKEIDIAVHSLKDMDTFEKQGLIIGSYLKRNDPRDVFLSKNFKNLKELEFKIVGSSSKRREFQMNLINKKIKIKNIRGNIDSRIEKMNKGLYDGIILAYAGCKTLKLEENIKKIFPFEQIIPAVGQGIIVAQCRSDDQKIIEILKKINNIQSQNCALAEKEMLRTLCGDCDTAVGGIATIENEKINLKGQLFSDDGKRVFNCELTDNVLNAKNLGKKVGQNLLEQAGSLFTKKK